MDPTPETRQGWLYLSVGAVFLVGVVLLLYLPVAASWSSRTNGTGFQERDPTVEYVTAERNWPMRQLPFLYDPLMRSYAGANGWSFFGHKRLEAFPHPEVVSLVFVRDIDPKK